MTAKEYLMQAKYLEDMIKYRQRDLEYWRDMTGSISSPSLEPHYNPNRNIEAPFIRVIEKIDELERDIVAKMAKLVELKLKINTAIDNLPNSDEKMVLTYRYMEHMKGADIQHIMHISRSTYDRYHKAALEHFVIPD